MTILAIVSGKIFLFCDFLDCVVKGVEAKKNKFMGLRFYMRVPGGG
jgi:hypothetical protein